MHSAGACCKENERQHPVIGGTPVPSCCGKGYYRFSALRTSWKGKVLAGILVGHAVPQHEGLNPVMFSAGQTRRDGNGSKLPGVSQYPVASSFEPVPRRLESHCLSIHRDTHTPE